MSVLGLVQRPGKVVNGEIMYKGRDLLKLTKEELRAIRGRDIAMIFQDPLSSLNPVLKVGYQIEEAMHAHDKIGDADIENRTIDLLKQVRVSDPTRRVNDFPHQFSGGMRQRAMIAMGLSNKPDLLIADEPTTALDVTVQAQILELLRDLNEQTGAAIILITHNLGVVAGLCKRVLVMYAGEIVEEGTVEQIFEAPQHPYTWSLLRSVPRIDANRGHRLLSIEGLPPDLIALPDGCKFNPRCPFRIERCFSESPPIEQVAPAQHAACWVTMEKAYADMGAGTIKDTSPGAASGVHPAGRKPLATISEAAEVTAAVAPEPEPVTEFVND